MIKSSTLRPGLLVVLKTSLVGNVNYVKTEIEADHAAEDGTRKAKWETERRIADAAEHEAGQKARGKVTTVVRAVCAHSAFGLLCPEADEARLDKAIQEAREIEENFNATATLSRMRVSIMKGRIAPDDVEAVKAINGEVRDLLADMERGLRNLDVTVIRDAASRAKELGAMLEPTAAARVQIAVDAARAAAKNIVKAGETAAAEIDETSIRKITEQRTAFLDLDETKPTAAPKATGRAVDLAPEAPVAKIAAKKRKIEVA